MYPIDFNTATMGDVIRRSMVCHPSVLMDAMRVVARNHERYAIITHNKGAKVSAARMGKDARYAIRMVDQQDVDALVANFSAKIQTFEQACRLQLVPHGTRAIIATREDGSV
jgi:hypothetical protein